MSRLPLEKVTPMVPEGEQGCADDPESWCIAVGGDVYTEPKFAIDAKLIFTEEQVKSETAGSDEKAE